MIALKRFIACEYGQFFTRWQIVDTRGRLESFLASRRLAARRASQLPLLD